MASRSHYVVQFAVVAPSRLSDLALHLLVFTTFGFGSSRCHVKPQLGTLHQLKKKLQQRLDALYQIAYQEQKKGWQVHKTRRRASMLCIRLLIRSSIGWQVQETRRRDSTTKRWHLLVYSYMSLLFITFDTPQPTQSVFIFERV